MYRFFVALQRNPFVLLGATAAFFTLLGYFPLRNAGLWFVDDHEIVAFYTQVLQADNLFVGIYEAWLKTEVGNFPDGSRFRPVYYFARIVKTVVLGPHGDTWFAWQFTMLFMALFAFGLALKRFFALPIVCAFLGLAASLPFNFDMWARLGPGENGAFLLSMFFILALSYTNVYKWAWGAACIFAALAMGYKENFILLMVPLCSMYIYSYYAEGKKLSLPCLLPPTGMAILLALMLYSIASGSSGHVYGADVSSQGLFALIPRYLFNIQCLASVVTFIPAIVLLWINNKLLFKSSESAYVSAVLLIFAVTMALSFANYIFYQGNISSFSRYAFPFHFFVLLPCLLSAHVATRYYENTPLYKKCLCFAIAGALLIIAIVQVKLYKNSLKQEAYIQSFQAIVVEGEKYEELVLFNHTLPINSYEAFFSLKRFAEANLTAPEIRYFPLFFSKPTDTLNVSLEKTLKNVVQTQGPIQLAPKKTLMVTVSNLLWSVVEFTSAQRKSEDVPQQIIEKKDKQSTVLFLATVHKKLKTITLLGKMPKDVTFSVNGVQCEASFVGQENSGEVVLNVAQMEAPDGLFRVDITYPKSEAAQMKVYEVTLQ